MSDDELLKRNLLRIVRHHKEHCDDTCNVSVSLVLVVAERAGLDFTNEEKREFA